MLGMGEILCAVSPFPSLEPPCFERPSLERPPLSLEVPTFEPPSFELLSFLSFECPTLDPPVSEVVSRMVAPSIVLFLLRRPTFPCFERFCFDRFCFELADGAFDTFSLSSIVMEDDRVLIVSLSGSVLSSDFNVPIVALLSLESSESELSSKKGGS